MKPTDLTKRQTKRLFQLAFGNKPLGVTYGPSNKPGSVAISYNGGDDTQLLLMIYADGKLAAERIEFDALTDEIITRAEPFDAAAVVDYLRGLIVRAERPSPKDAVKDFYRRHGAAMSILANE